jgi:hypothetical protein|tara:strand:- start:639 stop:821 length:183 start_codon:yes stop_codon:yes gene_type:complete
MTPSQSNNSANRGSSVVDARDATDERRGVAFVAFRRPTRATRVDDGDDIVIIVVIMKEWK